MVLIQLDVVAELGLPVFTLDKPELVDVAISFSKGNITRNKHSLVQYCEIQPYSPDSVFHSKLIHAVICPGLCMPLIFGLLFLELNDVVCDHKKCACILCNKNLNYNLLTPVKRQETAQPKMKLRKQLLVNKVIKETVLYTPPLHSPTLSGQTPLILKKIGLLCQFDL